MNKQNHILPLCAVGCMMILIFDARTAISGIHAGIDICLRTLIPSLFPFFVLSGIMTSALMGQSLFWLRPIGRLCRMPEGSEPLLAMGILSGYPVGAGNLWNAYQRGQLSLPEARRMVTFCNNAGPAFIFGVLGPFFPSQKWTLELWVIQVISSIAIGIISEETDTKKERAPLKGRTFDIMNNAIRSMSSVCGWVIFFRMVFEFLNRWLLNQIPPLAQIVLTGLIELSNGALRLNLIDDISIRFLIASIILSLGGLCILMQTLTVFPKLDIRHYLTGRMLHAAISFLLSMIVILFQNGRAVTAMLFLGIGLTGIFSFRLYGRKTKKEVAIP